MNRYVSLVIELVGDEKKEVGSHPGELKWAWITFFIPELGSLFSLSNFPELGSPHFIFPKIPWSTQFS